MSWKHWTAVVLVIGVGIILQIPCHDEKMEEHHRPAASEISADSRASAAASRASEPVGPYRTVALHITGMT